MVKRLATLASLLAACGQPHTFTCAADAECGVAGRCEANAFCSFPDTECASGSRYGEHSPADVRDTCVEQPSNAACEAAGELVTGGGATTGELRGAGRSVVLSCSPQITTEAFYSLTLPECSDVTLRAEAPGGNVGVALLDDCASELGCRDAHQTFEAEVLQLDGVAAGTYQIAVGGVFYDGTFDVSTTIEPAPSNDVMGTELPLVPGFSDLALARANDDRTCGSRVGGRDLFFQLPLAPTDASNGTLLWKLNAGAGGFGSTDFAVELIAPNGSSLGCQPTPGMSAWWRDLVPGIYTLVVDGPTDGSCGHFSLAASTSVVQDNDTCTTPRLISVASTTVTPFERFGTLENTTNDSSGSCGGIGGDVVYRLHVADRTHLRISVAETGGGFTPVVYVRPDGACGAVAAEVPTRQLPSCDPSATPSVSALALGTANACAKGPASGTATLDLPQIEPGDYLVFVDSEDDIGGDYKLTVDRARPTDDLRPGTSVMSNCAADPELPGVTTCCSLVSTVEAVREVISCGNPHPDVFQSRPLPVGCGVTAAFAVFSETPHQVEMVPVGSCVGSGVCGSAATVVNGLYTSSVSFTLQATTGGTCSAVARVTSLDPFADRGAVLVRYVQDGEPFHPGGGSCD